MPDPPSIFNLTGKILMVTGASSGIGRQTAITCSKLGATILLVGRNQARLEDTFRSLDLLSNHRMYTLDITKYSDVEDMMNEMKAQKLEVNGLVNAAGISTTLPFKMVSPEKMEEYFRVNTIAGMNLSRLLITKGLNCREGMSIVYIASVMGTVGEKGKSLYAMTKGALLAGARSMAIELAPRKVRVNTVSPGVVVTPMSGNSFYSQDKTLLGKIRDLHPLGLGQPEDVANACAYLLSDAAKWITGSNIIIDGGYTAR